jgi:RHS repeat-associated protein
MSAVSRLSAVGRSLSTVARLLFTSRSGWAKAPAVAALALIAPVGLALAVWSGAGARLGLTRLMPVAADTVFGPEQFVTTTGGQQTHVEQFSVSVTPGKRYTVQVTNGATDGSLRINNATVTLNGTSLFAANAFSQQVGYVSAIGDLAATNTLSVTVQGAVNGFLTIVIVGQGDPTFLVYGPTQFERSSSIPNPVTTTFTIPATAAAPFTLHVANGDVDGTERLSSAYVTLNGTNVLTPSDLSQQVGAVVKTVTLLSSNTLTVDLRSQLGSHFTIWFTATDTTKPTLHISAPAPNTITNQTTIGVSGTVTDQTATTVAVNGTPATVTSGEFSATVPLNTEGSNTITIVATDAAGNHTDSTRTVIRDTHPPALTVNAPTDGFITKNLTLTVSGSVTDATPVTVNANGVPLPVDGAGQFTGSISLNEGANFVTVTATDAAGNNATVVRVVTRDTQAPVLVVNTPSDGSSTNSATATVSGTVTDLTALTLTVNGQPVSVAVDHSFTTDAALNVGANTITVTATDAATNSTTVTRSVTRTVVNALPPDPSTVAPKLDMSVATTTFSATQFLYTGANPIQSGVDTGTINPVRVAVLRGRVLGRDNLPVTGVTIGILGHAEFGHTLSRADGRFDMAVNGGGALTISYAKTGFLSVQRTVTTPWQDFLPVDDVVMIGLDPQVTTVDFSTPIQVARGSVQTDADGSRQATMLFRQGTTATMVLPDSSTVPLSSLHVRATEYTVGPTGPQAMPAQLPPTSAYTYAVELSADEAIAAGATSVQFSQPVVFYVDNFLHFKAGVPVPAGFYDPSAGAWIPMDNGRVIKIVGQSGGLAQVDVNGDGVAETPDTLATLGVDSTELARLATLYATGTSLWRVSTPHFSPMDLNFPSLNPKAAPPKVKPPKRKAPVKNPCESSGSIIECQNQVLGERVGLSGTGMTLNYRSNRVRGDSSTRAIDLQLVGDSVPAGLVRVRLTVNVAGRQFVDSFPAQANQFHTFIWDGFDAYGRRAQGAQLAKVKIENVYRNFAYQIPTTSAKAFGLTCPFQSVDTTSLGEISLCFAPGQDSTVPARGEGSRETDFETLVGGMDLSASLGGWTLDAQHAYDPVDRVLYRGDGARVSAGSVNAVLKTIAGNGSRSFGGDGGPATVAAFKGGELATGPDGSIYLADENNARIRRITPDGIINTIGGTGDFAFSGDGGPASVAGMDPIFVVPAGDGTIYFADYTNHRIRRIDGNGIVHTVVGTGVCGNGGDDGPAVQATICFPINVAVGPDGSIYVMEFNRVRKVTPDGIMHRIAGNDGFCTTAFAPVCSYGIPAIETSFEALEGIALGPDGSVYVTDNFDNVIKRIGPDGIVSRVAGNGTTTFSGDGGPALAAGLRDPKELVIDRSGSLYFLDRGRVRRITPDGIINTIAGTGLSCNTSTDPTCGEGQAAVGAPLSTPAGIALGLDGSIYVDELFRARIRRIAPPLPGFTNQEFLVASEDGSAFYHFAADGRHTQTIDAQTAKVLARFDYNASGLLADVADADSNVTIIQRATDGTPTAIVGPFGGRNTFALDTARLLSSVTNAAGETVHFTYQAGGLLKTLTDPRNNTHTFTYDSLGRLIKDENPANGSTTLSRFESGDTTRVTEISALGRTSKYETVAKVDGSQVLRTTSSSGHVTQKTFSADGSVHVLTPDGSVMDMTQRADPQGGMTAATLGVATIHTPGGLTSTTAAGRKVTFGSADNPLSLLTRTDSVVMNGRLFRSLYTAATRTGLATTPEGRVSSTIYDSLGRVVATTVPGMDTSRYVYDARGRLSQAIAGPRRWTYTYGADGRVASVTNPLHRTSSYTRDSVGRILRSTAPDGRFVQYAYDSSGNLTAVTPPSRGPHTFSFTTIDQTDTYNPPALGTGATPTRYTYNRDRQVDSVIRADGTVIKFAYDTAGRTTTITHPDGATSFGYSSATGQLSSVTAGTSTVGFTYDAFLPLTSTWSGPVAGTVSVGYDNNFRATSVGVNGSNLTFTYDQDGFVTSAAGLVLSHRPSNGLVDSTRLNNVTSAEQYDEFGQWTDHRVKASGSDVYRATYARDSIGRVASLTEVIGGVSTLRAFTYDTAARLATVTSNGTLTASYQYDDNGNRLSVTRPGGIESGTYDAQDRLTSYGTATYGYTAVGDLRFKAVGTDTTFYKYDALGNLLQVSLPGGTVIQYVVDGMGRRIGKKVNGTLVQGFLYQDQLHPIAELDGSGTVVSRFIYAGANSPSYMIKSGVAYRLIADQLGSVRLVLNAADGTVAQRIDYDEFGVVTANTNPGFQPFGFAGGLYEAQTNLVRFGARDYDAQTGRWGAKDPLSFGAGDPNFYRYAADDPVNSIDPTGLSGQDVVDCLANLAAGFGDQVTSLFGVFHSSLTEMYRQWQGTNEGVDHCSKCYGGGQFGANAWGGAALGVVGGAVGSALVGEASEAIGGGAQQGMRLYRVFGDEAKGLGQYYTTVNPADVADFREAAGLFPGNSGRFVLEGVLQDTEGVQVGVAEAGPRGVGGGLPQVFVPNPTSQISVLRISGVNPRF